MATSEAQKRAVKKYNKDNTTLLQFKVNLRTERDILEILEAVVDAGGYKQTFIKQAIREKAEREGVKVGRTTDATERERPEFRYGMKHRGFSPGCQPKGTVRCEDDPTDRYCDIIVYDRRLTEREITDYELDDLN